jgi:hypothetical protein
MGGTHGEFICTLLSKDENYINAGFTHYLPEDNRHGYRSMIDSAILTFDAWNYPTITDNERHMVERLIGNKHVAMKTFGYEEHTEINLNIKKIKFFCEKDQWLFAFMLSGPKGLKVSAKTHPHTFNAGWIIPFIETYSKYPELNDFFIKNVETVTWVELDMLALEIPTVADYVQFKIDLHKHQATIKDGTGSWIYLNPLELFNEPEANISKWQEIFDTKRPFDISELTTYHDNNFKLLERTYGKSYNDLLTSDYKQIMIDYLLPKMLHFK